MTSFVTERLAREPRGNADPVTTAGRGRKRLGVATGLFRRGVHARLERLSEGELVVDDGTVARFGRPAPDGLAARLSVLDPAFYRAVARGGTLGAAESYLRGEWDSDDLVSLVRVLARNREALEGVDSGLARLGALPARALHALRRNSRRGSRRNIFAHYDLGNEFFAAFLDPSMTYSSAYFASPSMTLEEAQTAKIDRLCRKLQLRPSDHLLEIGSGWGSLAIHAARRYGCRVTTTTISPAQRDEALRRVVAAGLADRVEVLGRDYRDLTGSYDKLASVEMIEAVGHAGLPAFFAACGRLVKPGGLIALQSITIADRNYEAARRSVDFIQRYIFPGGALPSVSSICAAVAAASPLTPVHLEEMGLHYAETLRRWRERFERSWPSLEDDAVFDRRFRRLWRYYLAYCEGGFRERVIGVVQMVLASPGFRGETLRGSL
jgi:cyclopropane-fatty-acyl-phospholipid synthase